MFLKVINAEKGIVFDQQVYLVEANSFTGSFGVLEGHIPLIAPLVDNKPLKYKLQNNSAYKEISINVGILEVFFNKTKGETEVKVISS